MSNDRLAALELESDALLITRLFGLPEVEVWMQIGKFVDQPDPKSAGVVYMYHGSYATLGEDGRRYVIDFEFDGNEVTWNKRLPKHSDVFWQTAYTFGNHRQWVIPRILPQANV